MQLTPEVALSWGAGVLSAGLAVLSWRHRDRPGATALVAFNAGAAIWTLGNALQVASVTLPAKLFWVQVQYVGIALIPLSTFAFAARFTGHASLARRRRLAALGVPLVALVVFSWTNQFHHLVRAESTVVVRAGVRVLDRSFGPVFWAGWAYTTLLNLAATAVLVRGVIVSRDLFRRQVAALVVGALVPWVAQLLFLAGLSTVEPETFFAVSGAAFLYAVTRYRFLDVVPVARDAVFELLDDGVVVLDDGGRVVDANETARRVLGSEELVGRPAAEVFAGRPALLGAVGVEPGRVDEGVGDADGRPDGAGGSAATGGPATAGDGGAELVVDTDGGERYFDVRASPLAARGHRGTVILMREVTPLKERERALERSNERLQEFASVVSHDLRSPLAVVKGSISLERGERDSEQLRRAAGAVDRMDALIDDLLALARTDEAVAETGPVELGALARDAWATVDTDDAELVVATDRVVEADREQLRRALENLLANAVEHGEATAVRVEDVPGGFAVADDGVGIPAGERDAVLEWGYTGEGGGTGLGLAIVQRVAEAHGWRVGVDESDEGGARIVLTGVDAA